jgi:hypothetical protein
MSDLFSDIVEMPVRKAASISGCGTFRYRLTRYWGPGKFLPFVMLNPSTADAEVDDPTIRRCMSFARREGAGGIVVANLCAYRSPSPAALDKASDPFGLGNQDALIQIAVGAVADEMPIVCAWGAHGAGRGDRYAVDLFQRNGARLVCLGTTAAGHPRHPLYVKGEQPFLPYPSSTNGERT